jgi:hypothetical protein
MEYTALLLTAFCVVGVAQYGAVGFNSWLPMTFTSREFGLSLYITLCLSASVFLWVLVNAPAAAAHNQTAKLGQPLHFLYLALFILGIVVPLVLGTLTGYHRDTNNHELEQVFFQVSMNVIALLMLLSASSGFFAAFKFRQQKVFTAGVSSPLRRQAQKVFLLLVIFASGLFFYGVTYFLLANLPATFTLPGLASFLGFFHLNVAPIVCFGFIVTMFGYDILQWRKSKGPVIDQTSTSQLTP